MMYNNGYAGHWGWMLVSMIVTMLLLAGIVWIIARLIADGKRRGVQPTTLREPDALVVLQCRYASGEMDDAEYDHRRQILLGHL